MASMWTGNVETFEDGRRICYSAHTATGDWRVILWDTWRPGLGDWIIRNVRTGREKRVGPLMAKRTNYLTDALDLCRERNAQAAPAVVS